VRHQPENAADRQAALEALVACPVGSIGALGRQDLRPAIAAYPKPIEPGVSFCGFAAASSFGASSYFLERPDGNVLVDAPRFASQLVRRIEALGGIRTIFLTHRDDVADHAQWARHFGAERILHRADYSRHFGSIERLLEGADKISLAEDLVAIPTPGHTRGHTVLLYANRYLFSGDHLWWSPHRRHLVASRSVCWDSWEDQTRSMERLLGERFEWVLPGHGWRYHAPGDVMQTELRACIEAMRRR
jgi:glyoxylase-like metal-dependent hydrolase (beta-lactamase superfamily II)